MKRHCGDFRSVEQENVKGSATQGKVSSFQELNQTDRTAGVGVGVGGTVWLLWPPGRWVVSVWVSVHWLLVGWVGVDRRGIGWAALEGCGENRRDQVSSGFQLGDSQVYSLGS